MEKCRVFMLLDHAIPSIRLLMKSCLCNYVVEIVGFVKSDSDGV